MDLSTFFQNISEHKKRIIIGSSSVVAGVAVLIGYLQSGPNAEMYAKAERSFEKWEESSHDEALYQEMKEGLYQAPDLSKKYQSTITQKLLIHGKVDEALTMLGSSLSRVEEDVPFHVSYAKNSLSIEQGHMQQALESAVALKEQMGNLARNVAGGALLYTHNLLRIACLQQELKNRPGEKAAWEELERYLEENKETADTVLRNFSENNVNLSQYIAERKKGL